MDLRCFWTLYLSGGLEERPQHGMFAALCLLLAAARSVFISHTPQVALTPFYDPDPRRKISELPELHLCSASARASPHHPHDHLSSKRKF